MEFMLRESPILICALRDLQRSIAREPSAPSFSVPAYQSTPAPPAAGPTPAPRTVFVSRLSELQLLDPESGRPEADPVCPLSFAQAEQQPQAKPPARPPPPNFPPQAANAPPAGPPSTNPPPLAPPAQAQGPPTLAQGPPYPSYQGYPGYASGPSCLISDSTPP